MGRVFVAWQALSCTMPNVSLYVDKNSRNYEESIESKQGRLLTSHLQSKSLVNRSRTGLPAKAGGPVNHVFLNSIQPCD
jgi:hypothetical protein